LLVYIFGCAYNSWNEIRTKIVYATFKYIETIDNEENKEYIETIREITSFIANDINSSRRPSVRFIEIINTEQMYIDTLIYFNVGGLYALCNKSDCEGFYSPGNSYDICRLLDLIEPFIEIDEYYERIYTPLTNTDNCRLYDVFEESWKTRTKVIIL